MSRKCLFLIMASLLVGSASYAQSRIVTRNGRTYVESPSICNLTHIKIQVIGDDVTIRDVDVLFHNGQQQDVQLRARFAENGESHWKNLNSFNGNTRCTTGFFVDATSDRDRDRATIVIYGLQQMNGGDYREVNLASMNVREMMQVRPPRRPPPRVEPPRRGGPRMEPRDPRGPRRDR